MAKIGDYTISDIYQGGISTLDPSKSLFPSNYPVTTGSLGLTTDPRVGNILQEVSTKLSTGVKQIEVELVSPDMLDQIPKQQFEEIKRLRKLTGIDVSVHGPVIDTTGITQQGFSELNREQSERKIIETIKRSHEINPDGNVPVNFHSAEGIPGTEFKTLDGKREAKRLIVIDRESGKPAQLEEETMYYPALQRYKPEIEEKIRRGNLDEREIEKQLRTGKMTEGSIVEYVPLREGKVKTPESRMKNLNVTSWDNSISQLIFNKERADEILEKNAPILNKLVDEHGNLKFDKDTIKESPTTLKAYNHLVNASNYLEDTRQHIESLFHKAYRYGNDNQKKILTEISAQFKKDLENNKGLTGQSQAVQNLINSLKSPAVAPEMYIPIEQFAVEQSSKTFGNAAFEGWKKYGDKSPLVNIENPPVGFALSTGEDLKNLVEASRKCFIERAKQEGIPEKEAKENAEKLIGATWDVGHINMLRKQGFKEEDIIKETEKIAPLVKHVHLSDNFGFEHTELPMGMGNVPIKEIMEKLGKKGFEAKKIIEAAHWWQHFKNPPVQSTFELMGSPVYSDGVGPYWNQVNGLQQGYSMGYGLMLPNVNYQTFGAGFAQLPSELGGQMPGAQGGRMSGKSME